MTKTRLCLLLAVAGLSYCRSDAAVAIERENLRFYLSFEDGLQPSIAGAGTQLRFVKGAARGAQLVEGRRGRGLKVTPNLCLRYATRQSFTPKEGILAFWMKPVGWGGVNQFRYFLIARSDAVVLHFYIYYGNPWFYVAGPKHYVLVGGNARSTFEKEPFPEGQWTFLAATYKPGQQASYINGKRDNRITEGLIEPEFVKTGVVEIPPGDQVLDEIMVFDRALTELEIQAVYRANVPEEYGPSCDDDTSSTPSVFVRRRRREGSKVTGTNGTAAFLPRTYGERSVKSYADERQCHSIRPPLSSRRADLQNQ